MAKRFKLGFLGSILIWAPVALLGIFSEKVIGFIGGAWFGILMGVVGVGAVALDIFPFFSGGAGGYYFFLGKGRKARKILAYGRAAKATLLGIDENSGGGTVTINDDPYLNLKLKIDDGSSHPYDVSLDAVVPRYLVPAFQPGASFPVRIDPQDMQVVVFDTNQAALDGTGIILEGTKPQISGLNRTQEETEAIHKRGIKATAIIKSIEPTCKSHDFKPLVRVDYEVTIYGEKPYIVEAELPIPSHMVEQFKEVIGKVFPAKVHPEDRNKISVDVTFS